VLAAAAAPGAHTAAAIIAPVIKIPFSPAAGPRACHPAAGHDARRQAAEFLSRRATLSRIV
jgi:hypothetical protein